MLASIGKAFWGIVLSTHTNDHTAVEEVAAKTVDTATVATVTDPAIRTRRHPQSRIFYTGPADLSTVRAVGTLGYLALKVVQDAGEGGITFSDYMRAGGGSNHLTWDEERARVRVVDPDPAVQAKLDEERANEKAEKLATADAAKAAKKVEAEAKKAKADEAKAAKAAEKEAAATAKAAKAATDAKAPVTDKPKTAAEISAAKGTALAAAAKADREAKAAAKKTN
jgi:hypothetical protein